MIPERGQVVWVNFNPQRGHEQAGRRPALVISPSSYNEVSNCILLCPITSNITPWPWKVLLGDGEVSGAILIDQIKSVDREARALETTKQFIPEEILLDVLARLATLTS